MATKEIEVQSHLIRFCIEAAARTEDSIEKWRRQRRSLERLPSHLAESLLYCLLRRRLLRPSLLELFKNSVEEIDLKGENLVDAEWLVYIGAFRHLRSLNISNCYRITNSALWPISGMTTLREVDLSRCSKVTDVGIRHLLSIPNLEKISISETGVSANGVMLLSSLRKLYALDLGGLPVTDNALSSLQELDNLQYLDLWGSKISNKGAVTLKMFPNLTFLNLAWTDVTELPNLQSITCLNMSNCTIHSIFDQNDAKRSLNKLILSGATFTNEVEAFSYVETSNLSFLNLAHTSLRNFSFLPFMNALNHLDLSHSTFGDDLVDLIVPIGANLRNLNLSNTKVSSVGLGNLAGHVPNLESISLAYTLIDDASIFHISTMPSLKVIDLSNTNIKGYTNHISTDPDLILTLTALQCSNALESLNLEETRVQDIALKPLSDFQALTHLSLKSESLTDMCLHYLSSLPNLKDLVFRDAVLTDSGLESFDPPIMLRKLDLRGCWLVTEGAVLSFCKYHPQLEVKHEFIHMLPSDQTGFTARRGSQKKQKEGKRSIVQSSLLGNTFLDQRLKYTRDEMLAMQTRSLSLDSSNDEGFHEAKTRVFSTFLRNGVFGGRITR